MFVSFPLFANKDETRMNLCCKPVRSSVYYTLYSYIYYFQNFTRGFEASINRNKFGSLKKKNEKVKYVVTEDTRRSRWTNESKDRFEFSLFECGTNRSFHAHNVSFTVPHVRFSSLFQWSLWCQLNLFPLSVLLFVRSPASYLKFLKTALREIS